MGLRQSKRSVDISGSPKKDSQAAVLEKIPQTTDENTADKIEEVLIKAPINGDTKSAEVAELVISIFRVLFLSYLKVIFYFAQNKSVNEETKEVAVTDVANDVKSEEATSPLKDEKKEKVKKKRSFRSFSFLRREKKNKEENNKNGEITKEVNLFLFPYHLWIRILYTQSAGLRNASPIRYVECAIRPFVFIMLNVFHRVSSNMCL